MIRDLRTLLYLDLRRAYNRLRSVVAEPKRLLPWLGFAIWMLFLLWSRLASHGANSWGFLLTAGPVAAALAPGLALAFVGLVAYEAAGRTPALFASPADARFLIGSHLRPRLVVSWLQVRGAARFVLGTFARLLWVLLVLPTAIGAGESAVGVFAACLFLVAVLALRLPLFVLGRRAGAAWVRAAGGILVVAGALVVLSAAWRAWRLGGDILQNVRETTWSFPPGSWLVAGVGGDPAAIGLLAAAALAAVWISTSTAGDCYPELWEAAMRAFAMRAARRRRQRGQHPEGQGEARRSRRPTVRTGTRIQRPADGARIPSGERVPGGEWTLLWKAWLSARRLPGPMLGPLPLTALGIVMGAGMGIAVRLIPGANPYPLAGTFAYMVVIFTAVRAGEQLGADLGKSLWWLSDAPLRNRLLVHTLGGALIAAAPVGGGLLALGLVGNAAPLALWGIPLALSGFWLLRAAGLAVYALMPSGLDMRGPGAMLRLLGVVVMAVPTAAVAAGGWFLLQHFGLQAVATGGVVLALVSGAAACEGWLLVGWCAGRVLGRGLDFARAEGR